MYHIYYKLPAGANCVDELPGSLLLLTVELLVSLHGGSSLHAGSARSPRARPRGAQARAKIATERTSQCTPVPLQARADGLGDVSVRWVCWYFSRNDNNTNVSAD